MSLCDHGSVYAKILYDVDGNILVDSQNRMMNVYRDTLGQALANKEVRLFRNSSMGSICYRYFTTSSAQRDRFLFDREIGSTTGPNVKYHVYVDEDTDRTAPLYKRWFHLSREL